MGKISSLLSARGLSVPPRPGGAPSSTPSTRFRRSPTPLNALRALYTAPPSLASNKGLVIIPKNNKTDDERASSSSKSSHRSSSSSSSYPPPPRGINWETVYKALLALSVALFVGSIVVTTEEDGSTVQHEDTVLTNWSGTRTARVRHTREPESLAQLERMVARAHREGHRIRPSGSHLSPNGISFQPKGMLSMGLMDRVLHVNHDKQQVTVEAGIRVQDLADQLAPHGLTLQNYASIREQQVGGFTQVSAHGTGARIPPVDMQIRAMSLVTPAEGSIKLTPADGDKFEMAKVGLGALGVVSSVTLQCVPRHRLVERTFVATRAEVKTHHAAWLRRHKHLRYMWIPYTDAVVVVQCDEEKGQGQEEPEVKPKHREDSSNKSGSSRRRRMSGDGAGAGAGSTNRTWVGWLTGGDSSTSARSVTEEATESESVRDPSLVASSRTYTEVRRYPRYLLTYPLTHPPTPCPPPVTHTRDTRSPETSGGETCPSADPICAHVGGVECGRGGVIHDAAAGPFACSLSAGERICCPGTTSDPHPHPYHNHNHNHNHNYSPHRNPNPNPNPNLNPNPYPYPYPCTQVNQAEAEYWKRNAGERRGWSDEILGFDCGGQQWVLEVAFPTGTIESPSGADIQFMEKLLTLVEKHNLPAPAPIEQRWTGRSSSLLSPAYSDDPDEVFSWVGIIMYLPTEDPVPRSAITHKFQEYTRMVERELMPSYKAYWHWAKVEVPEEEEDVDRLRRYLQQRYPVNRFNDLRRRWDPKGVLSNDIVDACFGAVGRGRAREEADAGNDKTSGAD